MTDFEAIYQSNADPWAVRSCWYERRKRELLMASLPEERYGDVLEVGCGTGETSSLLAKRCERLWAIDVSKTAIERCNQHLTESGITNVKTFAMRVPVSWPIIAHEHVGLIVVSELAYYFQEVCFDSFLQHCFHSLAPGGDWLMCHYIPDFDDRHQETTKIHQRVSEISGMNLIVSHFDERFQLDVWRKWERGDS